MRKSTKLIALLLAGVLAASSLFACSNNSDSANEDEEREEQSNKDKDEDKDKDKDEDEDENKSALSPESAFDALEDAKRATFSLSIESDIDGERNVFDIDLARDNNIVKISVNTELLDEKAEQESYADLDAMKTYSVDDNGEWYWSNIEDEDEADWYTAVEEIRDSFIDSSDLDFVFEDDSYEKDGNRYVAKDSVIEDYIESEEAEEYADDATVDLYVTVDGDVYTYVFKIEGEYDGTKASSKLEVVIDLSSGKVKIPEDALNAPYWDGITIGVEEDDGDEDEDKGNAATAPDSLMTPNELYSAIKNGSNVSVDVYTSDETSGTENTQSIEVEMDGDVIMVETYDAETEESEEYIYNLKEQKVYIYDQEEWEWVEIEYDGFTWSFFVEQLETISMGIMTASDSDYKYDSDLVEYTMSKAALNRLQLDSAWIEYNEYEDLDNNTIAYYNYVVFAADSDFYASINVEFGTVDGDDILENLEW